MANTFDGAGAVLREARGRSGLAAESRGLLYGLHVGRFAGVVLRWLYFLNRLHGPPERSNRLLRCEIQEGVRPYIRAGVAVILLPMMAIRGQGSYLRDVLEVEAIHRISPGPA